jgi:hypothetical protein
MIFSAVECTTGLDELKCRKCVLKKRIKYVNIKAWNAFGTDNGGVYLCIRKRRCLYALH